METRPRPKQGRENTREVMTSRANSTDHDRERRAPISSTFDHGWLQHT